MSIPFIPKPDDEKRKLRRRIYLRVSYLVLAVCLIGFFSWFIFFKEFEMTLDAYVGGNQIRLTSQVPGIVASIWADDADYVDEGQILVLLDPTDADITLERAKATLGATTRQVVQMFEEVPKRRAEVAKLEADLIKLEVDYRDRKAVVLSGAVSKEDFIASESIYLATLAALSASKAALAQAVSEVEGTTIQSHPLVVESIETLRQAYVNRVRCTIRSPSKGVISRRVVQVGQQINLGDPLLVVVPLDQMWVDANFKETHLSRIRVGQHVKLYSDIYNTEVIFKGRVVGLVGGTGAVFSILPPQNATGNWLKIIQRLAVRIDLDPEQLKEYPLRIGLSMFAVVDVRDQSGPRIPTQYPQKPLYTSNIYPLQEVGSEELARIIIEENSH